MSQQYLFPNMKHHIVLASTGTETISHDIKVTYLGNSKWGCRCFLNGQLSSQTTVTDREQIGEACRELLRWECKLGNISEQSTASRERSRRKS